MFNTYLYQPIFQALVFLHQTTGNLGLAIIALTLITRLILIPLTLPAMKATVKMRDLQPEINKLKAKYKDDKVKLQQAQLELFQSHRINPAAGCLPYIAQFIILIALYRVFIDFLNNGTGAITDTRFLWMNLNQPDTTYILPVVSGLTQLVLSLMILPGASPSAEQALASSTPTKKDDVKADDMAQMAQSMQQQMLFIMPIMTAFLALQFPSGLALYWVISTVFSVVQQYYISGWGGLLGAYDRLKLRLHQ
jgi:YidC/Oxa1 family membrane protein insertase